MRRFAASLLTLLVAGCASAPPRRSRARHVLWKVPELERWKAIVVERSHFQAELANDPCPMPGILSLTDGMSGAMSGVEKRDADKMGRPWGR